MFKKLLLAAAFVAAPLAMTETASADHNRCYRTYRAPVITYGSPYRGYDVYRSRRVPVYNYGVPYRSRSISPYGYGYGGLGYGGLGYGGLGYPYGRSGGAIGINRGGLSFYYGF